MLMTGFINFGMMKSYLQKGWVTWGVLRQAMLLPLKPKLCEDHILAEKHYDFRDQVITFR